MGCRKLAAARSRGNDGAQPRTLQYFLGQDLRAKTGPTWPRPAVCTLESCLTYLTAQALDVCIALLEPKTGQVEGGGYGGFSGEAPQGGPSHEQRARLQAKAVAGISPYCGRLLQMLADSVMLAESVESEDQVNPEPSVPGNTQWEGGREGGGGQDPVRV